MNVTGEHAAGAGPPSPGTEPAGRLLELVSVHVPRTLGGPLAEVLVGHYGRQRVSYDYGIPLEAASRASRQELPPSAAVVHGHFPAARYADVVARHRVTFLREPIARTISHFFFWLSRPRYGNPTHNRMLDEHLGLLDFARLPPIRYFYTETIFGGCDLASFDLVGVVEDLTRDWPRFRHLTGIEAELPRSNTNPYPDYVNVAAKIMADRAVMRELRRILADEIDFYEHFA
jgi:hypothetical protein